MYFKKEKQSKKINLKHSKKNKYISVEKKYKQDKYYKVLINYTLKS